LDNVLRTYLIPRAVDILKPTSDLAFSYEVDAMARTGGKFTSGFHMDELWKRPPASTKWRVMSPKVLDAK